MVQEVSIGTHPKLLAVTLNCLAIPSGFVERKVPQEVTAQ
jgi:hypothetical protein